MTDARVYTAYGEVLLRPYSGVGTGPHRYWRLLFVENNDASYVEVGELEYRATVGGADQTGSGTASADTSYSADYLPAKAFDNDTATAWSSAGPFANQYLAYDFGTAVSVAQIALTSRTTTGGTYAPKTFDVQYSDDGSTWTTLSTITGQTAWGAAETRVFTLTATGDIAARTYTAYAEALNQPANISARTYTGYVEVLSSTFQIRMPKAYGLAVVGPSAGAVAVPKAYALAVLHDTAVGAIPVEGTASNTLGSLTSSASGSYTDSAATGTGANTLGSLTSAGTGTAIPPAITGTGANTLSDLTGTASGTHAPAITGTEAGTLGPLTSEGAGFVGLPAFTGTAGNVLEGLGSSGAAIHLAPVTGTSAAFLDALTSTGTGIHLQPVTGTAETVLEGIPTVTGTGEFTPPAGVVTWPPPRVRKVHLHASIRGTTYQ